MFTHIQLIFTFFTNSGIRKLHFHGGISVAGGLFMDLYTLRCTHTQYRTYRCKKNFYVFLFWSRFLRFLTFFYFPNVFLFKKKRWQSSERRAD